MYQPIELFISLRYMRGNAADRFSCFVSWLSTIGIALGVMALMIVLSVMNGFEQELQSNILELMPQVILSSLTGSINPQKLPKSTIKIHGIKRIAPLTTEEVILQSANGISLGIMLGIDPLQRDPLTPYLIRIKQTDLRSGKYNVILGEQLAKQLEVSCGNQLRVIVPSIRQFTPIGRLFSQRLFNIIGIFSTNSEVDSYQLLVNIQDASCLMHYPQGNITGWRLWLNEPLKVEEISKQKLPTGTKWQDWRNRKGDLFKAVCIEKNTMGLLLSLIIAIAVFNIISSLSLTIIEKRGEIAILQTQGITSQQIIAVFVIQGTINGIIGVLLGILVGTLLTSQLNNLIPFIGISLDSENIPILIKPLQVISIISIVVIMALLSTLYPSWRSIANQPVEALRYE